MLDVRKGAGKVKKFSNGEKWLVDAVCGSFLVIVIMLLEKKREAGFFTFADASGTALAENLVFPPSLENHANIITKRQNSIKSNTYAL
jgi:hypothetical protein